MSALDDTDEERNTERMNFRLKPRIKKAIQRAASLSGMDDSAFALNAAYEKALQTIASHERTVLKPEDYEVFFSALDNPPPPTRTLIDATRRHDATILSR